MCIDRNKNLDHSPTMCVLSGKNEDVLSAEESSMFSL